MYPLFVFSFRNSCPDARASSKDDLVTPDLQPNCTNDSADIYQRWDNFPIASIVSKPKPDAHRPEIVDIKRKVYVTLRKKFIKCKETWPEDTASRRGKDLVSS